MSKTVGIIGLGLLGGSLAKALVAYAPEYNVVGYARRQEVCDAALKDACVSMASTQVEDVIQASDIVVFALPPDTSGRVFEEKAHLFKPGQVVTDVASTKTNFSHSVYKSIPEGVIFVSLHPMAGSEKGGYEMTSKDLFQKATWIVLEDKDNPHWDASVAEEFDRMGEKLGSHIRRVQLSEHDGYLAGVSHAPHLMSSIIATVGGGGEIGHYRMQLAAGGFRDVTRVSGGNPSMWREIIMGNRQCVLKELNAVEREIEKLKVILTNQDEAGLETYLADAKKIRDTFADLMLK